MRKGISLHYFFLQMAIQLFQRHLLNNQTTFPKWLWRPSLSLTKFMYILNLFMNLFIFASFFLNLHLLSNDAASFSKTTWQIWQWTLLLVADVHRSRPRVCLLSRMLCWIWGWYIEIFVSRFYQFILTLVRYFVKLRIDVKF